MYTNIYNNVQNRRKVETGTVSTFNNNPDLTHNAKMLRKKMTSEEKHLWYDFLKHLNVTVHRQKVIENYIVDFCIPSSNLIIELDGSQHYEAENKEYDRQRDKFLAKQGYCVLRYPNIEISRNFYGVCDDILKHDPNLKYVIK